MRTAYTITMLLCIWSCTPTTVIEPSFPPREIVDLGFLASSVDKTEFTPYFDLRTLIFLADNGEEYTFQMTQPIISENYRFKEVYVHPTQAGKEVEYLYTGERVNFEWTSAALGARFGVVFQPSFCGDPMLEAEGQLHEHLHVSGTGFNNGDISLKLPALDMDLTEENICGEGRYLGTIDLGDNTFYQVNYARQYFGDRYLEVYYTPDKGIVAFGTSYLFAVLDRSF